ncbi:MAG TPA: saccharopine dehydrogenase, partial [Polyangiales bacterium]|nr:saccharopine dehydrogenase [Polyangiales bacterium]
TREQRETGFFVYELVGTRGQDRVRVRVSADRDPGYGATSKMLGQAALCLALDADRLPVQGGSWTPASAMGNVLIERLNNVGVRFEAA